MPGNANNQDSNSSDMDLLTIREYLEELGSAAAEQNRCTLATACQLVLDGKGGNDLKKRVVKTIGWQTAQMSRTRELLSELVEQDLITSFIDQDTARHYEDDFVSTLAQESHHIPEVEELYGPKLSDGYVDVFFEDAVEWLIRSLAMNRKISPLTFDIDEVVDAVVGFLQENEVDVQIN